MVPTSQTSWAGSCLCPGLPECTRTVSATSTFLGLLALLEKCQVQLAKQSRVVPFHAFEEILVRLSPCLHTGTLPWKVPHCQGFWSTAMVFLCLLLYYCAYMYHRITRRRKDQGMPATGSYQVFVLQEPPQQVHESSEATLTYWKWKHWDRRLPSKLIS